MQYKRSSDKKNRAKRREDRAKMKIEMLIFLF